jgi:2-hydroxychromene-2-carboxylate isomerase
MPAETVDYYWSFRSHYCYLSIGRVMDISRRYPVDIRLRPVLPMVMRNPDFFASMPKTGPNRWTYIQHDAERIAERLNLPFAWPDPDPVQMDHQTYQANSEQPHILRFNRLALAAESLNRGLEFASAVAGTVFGGVKNWHQGTHIKDALAARGLELSALEQLASSHSADYDRQIVANGEALFKAGHWGVPTLVFSGEPFFGQDRLKDFCWRLEQQGIKPV